jgi:tetratricopeptide (TPR) repeat protein
LYWRLKAAILDGYEDSEKALPCIIKSLELDPRSADAYAAKANILLRLGHADQALTAIDQALKLADHPNLHCVRAYVLTNQRKFDLAEKELDTVIKADPNNLIARSGRAKAAAQTKHWQKAIDDLTFALTKAKKKQYSYYGDLLARVEAYTATKQYEKAIADCKAGIEGQPELPQFHVALLKVYTMNGNKAGAASERKALSDMDVDYQAAKNFGS